MTNYKRSFKYRTNSLFKIVNIDSFSNQNKKIFNAAIKKWETMVTHTDVIDVTVLFKKLPLTHNSKAGSTMNFYAAEYISSFYYDGKLISKLKDGKIINDSFSNLGILDENLLQGTKSGIIILNENHWTDALKNKRNDGNSFAYYIFLHQLGHMLGFTEFFNVGNLLKKVKDVQFTEKQQEIIDEIGVSKNKTYIEKNHPNNPKGKYLTFYNGTNGNKQFASYGLTGDIVLESLGTDQGKEVNGEISESFSNQFDNDGSQDVINWEKIVNMDFNNTNKELLLSENEISVIDVAPKLFVEGKGGNIAINLPKGSGLYYSNLIVSKSNGLKQELMTGFIDEGTHVLPISRITLGILEDMGYKVDYNKADPLILTTEPKSIIYKINDIELSYVYDLIAMNDKIYFASDDKGDSGIWIYDPINKSKPKKVSDINIEIIDLIVMKDKLFFRNDELWVYDPINKSNPKKVTDINTNGYSYVQNLIVMKYKLYFSADDGENNRQLWVYDPDDNLILKKLTDINERGFLENLTVMNDKLYFSKDGILWVYDPVDNLTSKIATNSFFENLTVMNDKLYFSRDEIIWVYNPVDNLTSKITTNRFIRPSYLTVMNDKLYFSAGNFNNGYQLWVYNPNSKNSKIPIKMVTSSNIQPYNLIVMNDKLYFSKNDELWVYNPDGDTTSKMINNFYSDIYGLKVINDKLYITVLNYLGLFDIFVYEEPEPKKIKNNKVSDRSGSNNMNYILPTAIGIFILYKKFKR